MTINDSVENAETSQVLIFLDHIVTFWFENRDPSTIPWERLLYKICSRSAQMVGELLMEWYDEFICEQKQDTQHESKRCSTKIEI